MKVAGIERSYLVFRPPSLDTSKPAPLVVAIHGYGADAMGMEETSHFDDLATKVGFIVVYPEGIDHSWNAGTCCGQNTNDDVAFIKALIERFVSAEHVDPKRLFATGMSNGGFMAQRLGCELSDQLSAVASVSGSLVTASCNPSQAVSVLEMHGLDDFLVPYEGGATRGLGQFPPTMSVMKRWASLDGCAVTPAVTQSGKTTTYTWTKCRDDTNIVLVAIAEAGHKWFRPVFDVDQPDATQVVWDFFSHSSAR
jgi:polyhydroxybutyrate depolymerase